MQETLMEHLDHGLMKMALRNFTFLSVDQVKPYIISSEVSNSQEFRDYVNSNTVDTREKALVKIKRLLDEWGHRSYFQVHTDFGGNVKPMLFHVIIAFEKDALDLRFGHISPWYMQVCNPPGFKEEFGEEMTNKVARVIANIIEYTINGILSKPTEWVVAKGNRSPVDRARNRPHVYTISLSESKKRYLSSHGVGIGGWKMPEHEVRGHWRTLRSGKAVFIRPHHRGDASVPRKTVTRIVP